MLFTPNSNAMNGVISYYNRKNHNNISKLVNVVSIGTHFKDKWSEPFILVAPDSDTASVSNNWCSPDINGSFVQIAFLKDYFVLNSYTLKSRTVSAYDMPVSWKVYGSLDGVSFDLIDTKTNRPELRNINTSNFTPDKPNYRLKYLKIEQVINSETRFFFCLNRIELFGVLIKGEHCTNRMNVIRMNSASTFILILIYASY